MLSYIVFVVKNLIDLLVVLAMILLMVFLERYNQYVYVQYTPNIPFSCTIAGRVVPICAILICLGNRNT